MSSFPMMCGNCGHNLFTVRYEGVSSSCPSRMFITCSKCNSISIINHESVMRITWGNGDGILAPDTERHVVGQTIEVIEQEKLLDKKED